MKSYLIVTAIIININLSCSSTKASKGVLEGLAKSYVLNKEKYSNQSEFFDEYRVDYVTFKKDSVIYFKAVRRLLESDVSIISELLRFEDDQKMCNWIKTIGPYSSTIKEGDMFNKSIAAKILVDNYILNRDSIIVASYINNITYSWLKSWYKQNKSRELLRNEYEENIGNVSN